MYGSGAEGGPCGAPFECANDEIYLKRSRFVEGGTGAARWPTDGVVAISSMRDTPGPMGSCVADVALLDAVVAGDSELPKAADLGKYAMLC